MTMAKNAESAPKSPDGGAKKGKVDRPRYPGVWQPHRQIPLRQALDFIVGQHPQNRVVGRLVDARMSKRNAESLVREASYAQANSSAAGLGRFRSSVTNTSQKAAEGLDSFRPRKERPQVD